MEFLVGYVPTWLIFVLALIGAATTVVELLRHLGDFTRWVLAVIRKQDRRQIVEHRVRVRAELLAKLPARSEHGFLTEIIVRDVARLDRYGDPGSGRTAPEIRLVLEEVNEDGIEVASFPMLSAVRTQDGDNWRFVAPDEAVEGQVAVYAVGRIPFEFIERIDWYGDGWHPFPHVYCRFDGVRGGPCTGFVLKGRIYDWTKRLAVLQGLDFEDYRRRVRGASLPKRLLATIGRYLRSGNLLVCP